jgi:glutamine synthetase
MTFDGSSIDGFGRTLESDVLAMPDANTFECRVGDDTKGNGPQRLGCSATSQPRQHPVRG